MNNRLSPPTLIYAAMVPSSSPFRKPRETPIIQACLGKKLHSMAVISKQPATCIWSYRPCTANASQVGECASPSGIALPLHGIESCWTQQDSTSISWFHSKLDHNYHQPSLLADISNYSKTEEECRDRLRLGRNFQVVGEFQYAPSWLHKSDLTTLT